MSPEQQKSQKPAIKDDIYSIGALLINAFTGLSPSKFNLETRKVDASRLNRFIGSSTTTELISNCLDFDRDVRPSIDDILGELLGLREKIKEKSAPSPDTTYL
ncbi:hypothetical protein KK062_30175, partial [Fulvivirgaceae bacterium PWU5]|nr:hypothetical protein [Dawidia cretensis]